jgi:hypothetical protein
MSVNFDFELLCYFVDVDIALNQAVTAIDHEIAAITPEVF